MVSRAGSADPETALTRVRAARGFGLGCTLVVLALLLGGCSESKVPVPSSIPSGPSDPAMTANPAMTADPAMIVPDAVDPIDHNSADTPTHDTPHTPVTPANTATSVASESQTLRRDKATQRLYVPGMGWVMEREFWRLYEQQPMRLPADLDLHALHQLRATMADANDAYNDSAGVN